MQWGGTRPRKGPGRPCALAAFLLPTPDHQCRKVVESLGQPRQVLCRMTMLISLAQPSGSASLACGHVGMWATVQRRVGAARGVGASYSGCSAQLHGCCAEFAALMMRRDPPCSQHTRRCAIGCAAHWPLASTLAGAATMIQLAMIWGRQQKKCMAPAEATRASKSGREQVLGSAQGRGGHRPGGEALRRALQVHPLHY